MKRLDIQILRGVAVLGIMFAHFGALLPSGFIGVDVFFVISGFVITMSLARLHERETSAKRFLFTFWKRRFFRLVPALVVVLAVSLLAASLILEPRSFSDQVEMSIWSLFFAGNIGVLVQSRTGDYFDPGVDQNWFFHLWSLGVEEQFYLVFPFLFLLLITASWFRLRAFGPLIAVGFLALFSFSLALLNDISPLLGWGEFFSGNRWISDPLGYFSPITRAWQFLLGVLAALIVMKSGTKNSNWLPVFGAMLLLLSFAVSPISNLHPSFPTLLPMLAVFILLVFPFTKRVSHSRVFLPMRWLGDRSYSAYLWHWPIWLVISKLLGSGGLSIALSFLVTIVLSAISYRFVEQPFMNRGSVARGHSLSNREKWDRPANRNRKLSARSANTVLGLSTVLLLLFAVMGFNGQLLNPTYKDVWLMAQNSEVRTAYKLVEEQTLAKFNTFGGGSPEPQEFADCHFNTKSIDEAVVEQLLHCREKYGPGTMVIGDSHAVDLFGTLSSRFNASFLVGVTRKGCRPLAYESCPYGEIRTFLAENSDVFQLVIFEQAGFYLLQEDDGTPGSREMFSDLSLEDTVDNLEINTGEVEATADYLSGLSRYVPVKWFLPRAEPHISEADIIKHGCRYEFQYRPGQKEVFEKLDTFIRSHIEFHENANLVVYSQIDLFGFNLPADFMNCTEIYWKDGDHLSAAGEKRFGLRVPADFLTWTPITSE